MRGPVTVQRGAGTLFWGAGKEGPFLTHADPPPRGALRSALMEAEAAEAAAAQLGDGDGGGVLAALPSDAYMVNGRVTQHNPWSPTNAEKSAQWREARTRLANQRRAAAASGEGSAASEHGSSSSSRRRHRNTVKSSSGDSSCTRGGGVGSL